MLASSLVISNLVPEIKSEKKTIDRIDTHVDVDVVDVYIIFLIPNSQEIEPLFGNEIFSNIGHMAFYY